jgi:hypothetical protein
MACSSSLSSGLSADSSSTEESSTDAAWEPRGREVTEGRAGRQKYELRDCTHRGEEQRECERE